MIYHVKFTYRCRACEKEIVELEDFENGDQKTTERWIAEHSAVGTHSCGVGQVGGLEFIKGEWYVDAVEGQGRKW